MLFYTANIKVGNEIYRYTRYTLIIPNLQNTGSWDTPFLEKTQCAKEIESITNRGVEHQSLTIRNTTNTVVTSRIIGLQPMGMRKDEKINQLRS